MPRKKIPPGKSGKAIAKVEKIVDAEIDLTAEEAEAPAHGRKIVVEKRIYSRPLIADEAVTLESTHDDDEEGGELDALDDFDADLADNVTSDLLGFFDADGGDDGHKLRVFQMMKPTSGMKFQKGGMIYRGEIPYRSTFLQDVQEYYGGGVFRLQVVGQWPNEKTGNMRFGIIKSRTVTIAAPYVPPTTIDGQPQAPGVGSFNGSPHVPYLLNPPPTPADPPPTMREGLREVVEMVNMVDKLRGATNPQAQAQPITDPDVAALTLIARHPEAMEKISGGLIRTVMGNRGGEDESWASAAKELIRSPQGPEIVAAIVREFMAPIERIFTGGRNGQAQPGAPALPEAPAPGPDGQAPGQPGGEDPQGAPDPAQAQAPGQAMMLPEDHALALLVEFCRRNHPPAAACERLLNYADKINEEAPQYSIDPYIGMFVQMTPAQAVEFVKTQPGGAAVAGLSYAEKWTAELQALIKAQFGEITHEG